MDEDPDVSRWLLEFLLRNSENLANEALAKRVMAVIPISDYDLRVKKAVLLRTVECEVSEGSVSEAIIENLELVEELDSRRGAVATDSMKAAYCAVALECTAKFLVGSGKPEGNYFNAVNRIWRGRVAQMERSGTSQLLTTELKKCRDEVEAAIWDASMCEKLSSMNTRNNALKLVWAYVREAWALMGPPFIDWAAKLTAKRKVTPGLEDGGGRGNRVEMPELVAAKSASPCRGLSLNGLLDFTAKLKDQADLRRSGDDQVCDKAVDFAVTVPSSTDFNISNRPNNNGTGIRWEKVVLKPKHVAFHKRHRGPVRISSDIEDSETDAMVNRYNSLSTPEVTKVQEALKSSSLELRAVVTDPLPEALRVAETVVSDLRTTNLNHERPPEIRSEREANAANSFVDKRTEAVQSSDANLANPSCSYQNNVSRRSLMERNSTAHTCEWSPIVVSPETAVNSRLDQPSPKRNLVSRLNMRELTTFPKRRKVKRWTLLEEDTLRTGVEKFGKGNWKFILNSYRDIFEERTEVDLKDKWRNMTR